MEKLLIATTNQGKVKEISSFLKDLPIQLISLKDVGITQNVKEDGQTYEENSKIKALFYAKKSGLPAIADDGGLEISALNNLPGLNSKRWLGENSTEEELMIHMTKVAKELPDKNRNAKFVAVVTFALPNGLYWSEKGEVSGIIAKTPHLKVLKGYPYRSFFYLPEIKKYYHENELTIEETRQYNHRYRAIIALKPIIAKTLSLNYD